MKTLSSLSYPHLAEMETMIVEIQRQDHIATINAKMETMKEESNQANLENVGTHNSMLEKRVQELQIQILEMKSMNFSPVIVATETTTIHQPENNIFTPDDYDTSFMFLFVCVFLVGFCLLRISANKSINKEFEKLGIVDPF